MLYGQYGTLNIKKIFCLLSADGVGALFYFVFLENFVDGESAYFSFLLLFQLCFQTSEQIRRPRNQFDVT